MSRAPKSSYKDQQLWDHVAKSITPMKAGKQRVSDVAKNPTGSIDAPENLPANSKTKNNKVAPAPVNSPSSPHKPRSSVPHRVPGLADFDSKSRRRLGRGRIEIAARLDLHGMRRHEAHAALRGFLFSAQARGLRWVLVITGKGAPPQGYGAPPQEHGARNSHLEGDDEHHWYGQGPQGTGILRQSVPQWLAEPDLRAVVVSHTLAAPNHGGEGARYIQLRSKRRGV